MPAFFRRYRYEVALLVTILIWGANVPILKIALREMSTAQANAVRFTFGVVAVGVAAALELRRTRQSLRPILRQHGAALVGLGLLGYFFYQEAWMAGLPRTSTASAALLMATAPVWTGLFAHFGGLQRLQAAGWMGLLVALGGTAVVTAARDPAGQDTALGNTIMLGASVAWALYTTLSGRMKNRVSPATMAFVGMVVALPCLYGVAAMAAWTPLGTLSAVAWTTLVFSGTLSVGLTLVVWNAAIAHVGPTATAGFSYLTPLAASGFAYLLLGEPITLLHALGGTLLLGGLVLLRRGLAAPDTTPVEAEATA